MPPRSLTNATCCPVLGFHEGEVFAPLENVRRFGRPPEASVVTSSGLPYMLDMNMICDPSGDHAGEAFVPANRGQEMRWLEAID